MKVPSYKQRKNTCGPTALRMVFKFFKRPITEKFVIKSIGGLKSYGVKTVKLADFAEKSGFKVVCLSYNSKLAGGKTKIKKPNIGDILRYLKNKIPVILSVQSSMLYGTKPAKEGHFIVVTNYRNGIFYYNDPDDGMAHKIGENILMLALLNNALDSSAYFLAIWPQNFTHNKTFN